MPTDDVHPLFSDRPSLEPLAWEMMRFLHIHLPEDKAPKGWADFSYEQVIRAKSAALVVYAGAVEHAARKAAGCSYGDGCDSRGVQDPETGETPCAMENDGDGVCLCGERHEEAYAAAGRVRSLLPLDPLLQPFFPGRDRGVAAAALRIRKAIRPMAKMEGPIGPDELMVAAAALGVL